jgi:hypothetical protein
LRLSLVSGAYTIPFLLPGEYEIVVEAPGFKTAILQLNAHQVDGPAFDITRFNMLSAQQLAGNIRTFNSLFNNLRRNATKNVDVSAAKEVPFGERKYLQLRFEPFNTTNHVTMAAPNLTPTASTFGYITGQVNTPRRAQMGARLVI